MKKLQPSDGTFKRRINVGNLTPYALTLTAHNSIVKRVDVEVQPSLIVQAYESEVAVLKELATQAPAHIHELPRLKKIDESGFFDWYKKLIDWLQGEVIETTRELGFFDLLQWLASFLSKNWVLVVGVLLLLGLSYLVYRLIYSIKKPIKVTEASVLLKASSGELVDLLKKSLLEKNYLLAARIKWILFLKEQSSPHYRTPYEYFRLNSARLITWKSLLPQFYRSMFDPKANTLDDFQKFKQGLDEGSERK